MLNPLEAVFIIFMQPKQEVIAPEIYSAAGGEILVITIIISWIISGIVNPDLFHDNPLKDAVGYNNLCVGWDVPPATYVAAPLYGLLIHFHIRYMHLDLLRAELSTHLTPKQVLAVKIANFITVVGYCGSSLIFVIQPTVSPMGHSIAFIQLILCGWIGYAANFYETKDEDKAKGAWIFLIVFGLVSVAFSAMAIFQLVTYDKETGTMGPIPWYVTAGADYLWFGCSAVKGQFRPAGASIGFTYKLVSDRDYTVVGQATISDAEKATQNAS